MTNSDIIVSAASILSLASMYLAGHKHVSAWGVSLMAQGFWAGWAVWLGSVPLMVFEAIVTVIAIRNLLKWRQPNG